jgi:hypothetical protein
MPSLEIVLASGSVGFGMYVLFNSNSLMDFLLSTFVFLVSLQMLLFLVSRIISQLKEIGELFEKLTMRTGANRLVSPMHSRENSIKETAISLIYFRNLKKKHANIKKYLAYFLVVLIFLSLKYSDAQLIRISSIPVVFFGLLVLKERVVQFRIQKGLFGTNRIEARALIVFMVQNAEDIDFTDSSGKLRRILLPEQKAPYDSKSSGISIGEAI